MQKWEYLVLLHTWDVELQEYYWGTDPKDNMAIQDRLDELGKEGWELVAVRTLGMSASAFYHFKRPLE